ncbi:acyl-CoA-binding protein [Endozoicomonadaceae bacterium StTr2]
MTELEQEFEAAQVRVKQLTKRPGNEDLLMLYGLYKQAIDGNNKEKTPSRLNIAAYAKHQSWLQMANMDRIDCQKRYIQLVDKLTDQLS